MISYVSGSVNGNNIPEKCIKHPYYLWPRLCDRLEATGNIGLFRAYDYTNEKKLELFND